MFERFRFLAPCQRLRAIVCVLSAHLRHVLKSTCVCLHLRKQCLRSEITLVSRVANVLLLRFVAGNMDVNTLASKRSQLIGNTAIVRKRSLRNPQKVDLCVLASFSCRVYAETQGRKVRPVAGFLCISLHCMVLYCVVLCKSIMCLYWYRCLGIYRLYTEFKVTKYGFQTLECGIYATYTAANLAVLTAHGTIILCNFVDLDLMAPRNLTWVHHTFLPVP